MNKTEQIITSVSAVDINSTIVLTETMQGTEVKISNFEIGDIIKNRFVLTTRLGAGGMGTVYKALDLIQKEAKEKNPWVAIKLLNIIELSSLDALMCLQRETSKARSLSHPNIITVYDIDRDVNVVFMTMEYLDGISLEQWIKENAPATPEKCLPIWQAMASALEYSHQKGLVHCDFKPSNVIIDKHNSVKVIDFGISRAKADAENAKTLFDLNEMRALTPAYASCEMIEGLPPEPSDDIYALAIVIYEMLTGVHPYPGKTATQARAAGICPAMVDGLNKIAWQSLKSGLSYSRSGRPLLASDIIKGSVKSERFEFKWLFTGTALLTSCFVAYLIFVNTNVVTSNSSPSKQAITKPVLTESQREKVEILLSVAEGHMIVETYIDNGGNNASSAYQQVLKINPTEERAIAGLHAIADIYADQAKEYLTKNDEERANVSIKQGLMLVPEHHELLELQKELLSR